GMVKPERRTLLAICVAPLGPGLCSRLSLRDHCCSALLSACARRRPGDEVRSDGCTRHREDCTVLVHTGAVVDLCRGTRCQHGLRVRDFLIRWGEALVQSGDLVRAHAETALEARLASSNGCRQRV